MPERAAATRGPRRSEGIWHAIMTLATFLHVAVFGAIALGY